MTTPSSTTNESNTGDNTPAAELNTGDNTPAAELNTGNNTPAAELNTGDNTPAAELNTGNNTPPPSTPLIKPAQTVQNEKYDRFFLIVEKREEQRNNHLWIIMSFAIAMVLFLYIFAVNTMSEIIAYAIEHSHFDKITNLWHILLILLLPPTSLLIILIKGASFSANSSDFKQNYDDKKDKSENKNEENSVISSMPNTVIFNEFRDTITDIRKKTIDTVLPSSQKENK